MAINKVVYNNETLIDISGDTVTRDQLAYGITAHDSSGQRITGTVDMSGSATMPTKVSDLENDLDFIQNGTTDDVTFGGNVAVSAGGLLKVVTVTTNTASISGTSAGTLTAQVSPGDGWTPLGIVGYNLSRGVGFVYRAIMSSAGEIDFRVYNTTSNTVSIYGTVYVLCVRTSL